MKRLGARLGRALRRGDVVALDGALGSGKTTFAQGLAQGLDVPADRHVASPTFALVCEHPGRVPFLHADYYRVNRPAELAEMGLEEAFDRSAVAIEWAGRFPESIPSDALYIELTVLDGGERRVEIRTTGLRSAELAAVLAAPGDG
jgi:tRNA threonylcarbamoyladenosine biosynthesis protein TsaE